jgi:hypothetical protein
MRDKKLHGVGVEYYNTRPLEEERAPQVEEEENEFEATQDQNNNEFMEPQMQNYSNLLNFKVPISSFQLQIHQASHEDYDERVISALRGDRSKSEQGELGE